MDQPEDLLGMNMNYRNISHLNPDIIAAIRAKNVARVRILCLQDMRGITDITYLHLAYLLEAVRQGDSGLATVILLISEFKLKVNVELMESCGCTLHVACVSKAHQMMEYLLTFSEIDINRSIISYSSLTALGISCSLGDIAGVILLLDRHADINLVDATQRAGIDYSIQKCHFELTSILIDRGAAILVDTFFLLLNTQNVLLVEKALLHNCGAISMVKNAMSPLLSASYYGWVDIVPLLLRQHGAWNPAHLRGGKNAIELGRHRGFPEISRMIEVSLSSSSQHSAPVPVSPHRFAVQLQQLQDMGLDDEARNIVALERFDGNVERALGFLL